jgi:endonuclease/exonuclease/phosphatase (EEP) superfamily protein YafD
VDLEVFSSDRYSIATLVYSDPLNSTWLLIAVHGPPNHSQRARFWNSMENIIKSFSGPWMMIGDLNCISSSKDKIGGGGGG